MNDRRDYYSAQKQHYAAMRLDLEAKSKHFSILRLLCFVAFLIATYRCFTGGYAMVMIFFSVTFLIVFLWLIKRHDKIQRRKDWAERMLFINTNELDSINGQPSKLDNGASFFSTDSYYNDLDVFGKGSVYQLLNRTGTSLGAQALSHRLKYPVLNAADIVKLQQAITELSANIDLRQNVLASALNSKGKTADVEFLQLWATSAEKLSKRWWRYVLIAAPLLFVGSLVWGIVFGNYYWMSLVYTLNLAVCYFLSKGIGKVHSQLSGASSLLNQYADIFRLVSKHKLSNSLLSDICDSSTHAHRLLKNLSSLIGFFDQRMNLLVALFFNPIFFYDLHCILLLEKWKKHNASKINGWFNDIAQIEVLNSFATFAYNHPHYVFPKISVSEVTVQAKNLSHPLIAANKRIGNDVEFSASSKVILITGSNMSGKSTFLRTIGVNVLLAQCGAPVCADDFNFSPVNIYTSLRQNDSLQEDTSFFYAELKKLSEIVRHLETGEQALVLLDEVLRGTNSDDKTYGSQELIRRLIHFNALSLMATHDITLGKMEAESQGAIENYCFESVIENDELLFDYKLRKGVAVNKNATFLMKKMGIINTQIDTK